MANKSLKKEEEHPGASSNQPARPGASQKTRTTDREERLVRRYPQLRLVPPKERRGIVRAAILHPVVLGTVFLFGFLILPRYIGIAFHFLDIEHEQNLPLMLAKIGLLILTPLCILVPLLKKFLMPHYIRKVMRKRGYEAD